MKKQIKDFISQYETETEDMLFLVEKSCYGAVVSKTSKLFHYDPLTQ